MRSKAWLATRVSLRLARLPRTASSAQRSRRLRSTRAAAPVLHAHAEVTKTLNIFRWVQNLGILWYCRISFESDLQVVTVWAPKSIVMGITSSQQLKEIEHDVNVYLTRWTMEATWFSAWNRFSVASMSPGQWSVSTRAHAHIHTHILLPVCLARATLTLHFSITHTHIHTRARARTQYQLPRKNFS